jgi:hypothetical protein
MFDMLTPDLMGPSAFLLLNLLFISVVDVDTGGPGSRTKRSRDLIRVIRHRRNFLRGILGFEMSNGARSEIAGRARVLVGLCHAYEG